MSWLFNPCGPCCPTTTIPKYPLRVQIGSCLRLTIPPVTVVVTDFDGHVVGTCTTPPAPPPPISFQTPSTSCSFSLPAGYYTVTVSGPPFKPPTSVTVHVLPLGTTAFFTTPDDTGKTCCTDALLPTGPLRVTDGCGNSMLMAQYGVGSDACSWQGNLGFGDPCNPCCGAGPGGIVCWQYNLSYVGNHRFQMQVSGFVFNGVQTATATSLDPIDITFDGGAGSGSNVGHPWATTIPFSCLAPIRVTSP